MYSFEREVGVGAPPWLELLVQVARLPSGKNAGLRVQSSGFRVQGSGFRVQGSGLRVQGSRLRVEG